MNDLFGYVSRDERQAQCLRNWKAHKGHACVVAATGFGKTRVGINLITKFVKANPKTSIVIVVPTTTLKEQWEEQLDILGFGLNCKVVVINTAVKNRYKCELLVLDKFLFN